MIEIAIISNRRSLQAIFSDGYTFVFSEIRNYHNSYPALLTFEVLLIFLLYLLSEKKNRKQDSKDLTDDSAYMSTGIRNQ